MARSTRTGSDNFYHAAAAFVDRCLRQCDSLFTPGKHVWSKDAFDKLRTHFVDKPLTDDRPFIEKLREQLSGLPDEPIQLMTELLYIHLLITDTVGLRRKRETINEVLSWMKSPVTLPTELGRAFESGLVNPGTAYNTKRDQQLSFLVRFGQEWVSLPQQRRQELLNDPWQFREFVFAQEVGQAFSQRNALLHIVHPDSFEAITSREHKSLIAERFGEYVSDTQANVDRQVLMVREGLAPKYGQNFNFYQSSLEPLWRSGSGNWPEFVNKARGIFLGGRFEEEERNYKLRVIEQFIKSRQQFLSGDDSWLSELKRAFQQRDNNLTPWQVHDAFLQWAASNPEAARASLEAIWGEGTAEPERIGLFLERLPKTAVPGAGGRLALASVLLMAVDPLQFPPYRSSAFDKAYDLTDSRKPAKGASEMQQYDHALAFLDQFIEEASNRGLQLRDRLDAQGLVWAVTKWAETEPPDANPPPPGAPENHQSLSSLADELLIDQKDVGEIIQLLKSKSQVVFYGPPGTGKTYLAQRIAKYLAGPDGAVDLVQFHPSYAYEDFVEGYRPGRDGKGFELRPGPLKRFANLARENPEQYHMLIIDELNRGNVAKVFGELYFLLEYRQQAINLQYSEDQFSLPKNLLLIGTMNTADRSIALVDAALRRRFFFFPFFPDQPPIQGLLRRWLERHNPPMAWVADIVDRANGLLNDRSLAIGPSFFMRPDLNDDWVELIWKHSIMPYLEEQFYGQEQRLQAFGFDALRNSPDPGMVQVDAANSPD